MPLTKIVQVGAFTDDVARQINANFALLGAAASVQGAKLDQPAPPQSDTSPDLNLKYPEPAADQQKPEDQHGDDHQG